MSDLFVYKGMVYMTEDTREEYRELTANEIRIPPDGPIETWTKWLDEESRCPSGESMFYLAVIDTIKEEIEETLSRNP